MDDNLIQRLKEVFLRHAPSGKFASLRFLHDTDEVIQVRQGVLLPVKESRDRGFMVTICDDDGSGYAATSNLSDDGVRSAMQAAQRWCDISKKHPLIDFRQVERYHLKGAYSSNIEVAWESVSLKEKIDLLMQIDSELKISDAIVDWGAFLWHTQRHTRYFTSAGGDLRQDFSYIVPNISVAANRGSETQRRSLEGMLALSRQGGFEALQRIGFKEHAQSIAEEALQLLDAPNCPSGKMDVLLSPSQMMLQIHESIGHPLELDRILGDERNYAGTSFVKPEMFGNYRYGSPLLNITFDPSRTEQFASYGFDDEGLPARKALVIEKGILKRGLGSAVSQSRSGIKGVANARASSWNRPPIDRMTNLNLEPGDIGFSEMVAGIERGIYMRANTSWSIDDSRNKFQFGCEWARLIENGKLTTVVKNPNYRGISATFWRSLEMVGNADTFAVMGTPSCGKGEPNQIMRVGHAAPACVFSGVDVFGGE